MQNINDIIMKNVNMQMKQREQQLQQQFNQQLNMYKKEV